jgi:hypothetical protein
MTQSSAPDQGRRKPIDTKQDRIDAYKISPRVAERVVRETGLRESPPDLYDDCGDGSKGIRGWDLGEPPCGADGVTLIISTTGDAWLVPSDDAEELYQEMLDRLNH